MWGALSCRNGVLVSVDRSDIRHLQFVVLLKLKDVGNRIEAVSISDVEYVFGFNYFDMLSHQ